MFEQMHATASRIERHRTTGTSPEPVRRRRPSGRPLRPVAGMRAARRAAHRAVAAVKRRVRKPRVVLVNDPMAVGTILPWASGI